MTCICVIFPDPESRSGKRQTFYRPSTDELEWIRRPGSVADQVAGRELLCLAVTRAAGPAEYRWPVVVGARAVRAGDWCQGLREDAAILRAAAAAGLERVALRSGLDVARAYREATELREEPVHATLHGVLPAADLRARMRALIGPLGPEEPRLLRYLERARGYHEALLGDMSAEAPIQWHMRPALILSRMQALYCAEAETDHAAPQQDQV